MFYGLHELLGYALGRAVQLSDEPLLEEALASVCRQDYPMWQVVFGVQDAADRAIAVVRRLQARFPDRALDLVVSDVQHGPNRKIANLINMLPAAKKFKPRPPDAPDGTWRMDQADVDRPGLAGHAC